MLKMLFQIWDSSCLRITTERQNPRYLFVLLEIANSEKNIMTIESIAKYNLENVNQCELNENIGFNLDKALRFIEFQSPDVIYLEGFRQKMRLIISQVLCSRIKQSSQNF